MFTRAEAVLMSLNMRAYLTLVPGPREVLEVGAGHSLCLTYRVQFSSGAAGSDSSMNGCDSKQIQGSIREILFLTLLLRTHRPIEPPCLGG